MAKTKIGGDEILDVALKNEQVIALDSDGKVIKSRSDLAPKPRRKALTSGTKKKAPRRKLSELYDSAVNMSEIMGTSESEPSEEDQQAEYFRWLDDNLERWPEMLWANASANGAFLHPSVVGRLKRTGCLKPGVPDIHCPAARRGYHSMYIELKRKKDGRVREDQDLFHTALRQMGHFVTVAYGIEEAKCITEWYMGGRSKTANTVLERGGYYKEMS